MSGQIGWGPAVALPGVQLVTVPHGGSSQNTQQPVSLENVGDVLNQIFSNPEFISQIFALYFSNLPTTLPESPGVFWNNGGVVSIS
jgi:hypothetical protein